MADFRTTCAEFGGERRALRPPLASGLSRLARFTPATVAVGLLCAALLVLPGRTVMTAYVNDVFIFLDGAWRIASGHVPNRDFHTALGPLVFYLPAAAYGLTGSFGRVMPGALALSILLLLPALLHVAGSRLRPVLGIPFAAFIILIVAVPANLGESITSLSFAMFYNRIGWAQLALLLVMYLPPARTTSRCTAFDIASAAFLTLSMIYTKATFGVAALGFLAFMATDREARRWALPALLAVAATGGIVELFWRSSFAHIADLLQTARVSGPTRVFKVFGGLLHHIPDFALASVFAAALLHSRGGIRDALFLAFCGFVGLWILQQNAQPWGVISLHAGAAVAAEFVMREDDLAGGRDGVMPRAMPLLLLAILLPTIVHCSVALGLHTVVAWGGDHRPVPLPRFTDVRVAKLWSGGDPVFADRYLQSIADGTEALRTMNPSPSRVMVLDFSNPFSAGLGLRPPSGDIAWMHWNRNLNDRDHPAPEDLFGGSLIVMEPRWGINNAQLRTLYGDYVDEHFPIIRETAEWTIRRRGASDPAALAAEGGAKR